MRPLGRRVGGVALCALVAASAGCGERGSDIAVVYRGDASMWRTRVRVTLDSGRRARVVVPSFPSAAKPEPVATSGTLPVVVALLRADGDTVARLAAAPLVLAPKTSYGVNVVVSAHRPAQTACSGAWSASAVAPPVAESLYVSVTAGVRGAPAPRCDD